MDEPADAAFWRAMDELLAGARLVIDRPKHSAHPRYPALVYPLDYGYLEGTTAIDGGGVDVWRGSLAGSRVVGAVATVGLMKRDTELKLLVACTPAEMDLVFAFHNDGSLMKGLLLRR